MEWTHFEREVSIVDTHIAGGPLFLNCSHHRVHLILPSHVRLKDHASTAISLDFLENPLRGFLVLVVVNDDGRARLRKTLCRGRTETAAPPRRASAPPRGQ